MEGQFLCSGLCNGLSGISDTQTFIVNVDISFAIEFHFVLFRSVPHKNCMSVGINKPRNNAEWRTVDYILKNIHWWKLFLYFFRISNFLYYSIRVYNNWYVISNRNVVTLFHPDIGKLWVWYLNELLNFMKQ